MPIVKFACTFLDLLQETSPEELHRIEQTSFHLDAQSWLYVLHRNRLELALGPSLSNSCLTSGTKHRENISLVGHLNALSASPANQCLVCIVHIFSKTHLGNLVNFVNFWFFSMLYWQTAENYR